MRPLIVLTNERDFAADDVIRRLDTERVQVIRWNIESAQGSPMPSLTMPGEAEGPFVAPTVWWRQFELEQATDGLVAADALLVGRAQWRSWLATLEHPDARWINPLWAARRAENKIVQLRTAEEVGLPVPQTLITNDRSAALTFARRVGPCVVKTLASAHYELSDGAFVFTESLERIEEVDGSHWHRQPLVIQRQVDATLDVRVVAFAGMAFGASRVRSTLDWRKDAGSTSWCAWEVPPLVESQCHGYLAKMNLKFAAFDFLVDRNTTWFLEANQAGEWLFLDQPLDLGIAHQLSKYLQCLVDEAS